VIFEFFNTIRQKPPFTENGSTIAVNRRAMRKDFTFAAIAAVRLVTAPVSHACFESPWQPPLLARLWLALFVR
jgi:hypothetical protein